MTSLHYQVVFASEGEYVSVRPRPFFDLLRLGKFNTPSWLRKVRWVDHSSSMIVNPYEREWGQEGGRVFYGKGGDSVPTLHQLVVLVPTTPSFTFPVYVGSIIHCDITHEKRILSIVKFFLYLILSIVIIRNDIRKMYLIE